jgi:hypothetical protein
MQPPPCTKAARDSSRNTVGTTILCWFRTDPVALDYTGWQIIERKRARKRIEDAGSREASATLHYNGGRQVITAWARMTQGRFTLGRSLAGEAAGHTRSEEVQYVL